MSDNESDKMISIDPSENFTDNYKILIGSVLPRPIAFISTLNENGTNNLAPFSFFTAVSAKPMILAFCPLIRTSTGSEKDTPRNIKRTKEFVVNIFSEDLAQKVNMASTEIPYGEDEFKLAGLTPLDSEKIKAKRVAECPIHFECRLRDVLDYGNQPGAGQLITGEVIKIHLSPDLYQDGKILTEKLRPVGRGAGNDWFKTDSTFQLERLMQAQIQK